MPKSVPSRVGRTRSTPRDLENAVTDLGVEIYRVDDDEVHGWCPRHLERTGKQDRHPSWSVNRTSGLHSCFSCGYKGNFLSLVMDLQFEGTNPFAAARWIRQYGLDLDRARDLADVDWEDRKKVGDEPDVEVIDETRLALYVDPPDWALQNRGLSLASCRHYGVLWDAKKERWIIPIRQSTGVLVGWQIKAERGRFFRNHPEGVLKRYCLFGYQQFPVGDPAVLVESPLDVPRLYTLGWEGGLSGFGAAVTDRQMELIAEVTDELICALDDDTDGRKYSEILRAGERERGRQIRQPWSKRLNMRFFCYDGTGKDPGELDKRALEYGFYNAQHSTVARFGETRELRRTAARLSDRRRREDARPWTRTRRVPTGRR